MNDKYSTANLNWYNLSPIGINNNGNPAYADSSYK